MDYKQKIKAKLKTLPHKYQVRYALDCALEVKHLMKNPRSLKALEIIELWLQGKVTKDEFAKAAENASYVFNVDYKDVSYTSYAASNAAYAAYAAYYACYACYDASYDASYAAFTTSNASEALNKPLEEYYTKLLKFIDNLTELEKVIYNIK